jgi:tetraacyldisaccharide 4'-kinase
MRPPEFWSHEDLASRAISATLAPLGTLYGESVAWRRRLQKPCRPDAAVICIGNLTVGGAGKTPVAIAIARILQAASAPVFFLTRGYRRRSAGALRVDTKIHDTHFVGDEALLLARVAPTIVATDRAAGARLAQSQGARVIVMDDGHQNFDIAKDLSVVVIDSDFAFGNGRIVPAGPLRESVQRGLTRADAVVLMGQGNPALAGFSGRVCRASLIADRRLDGQRVVAFAGIGRPSKFFDTLKGVGAKIVECHSFGDHHVYSQGEIAELKRHAAAALATPITTEKDFVRLNAQDREDIEVLPVQVEFENPTVLEPLLDSLLAKMRSLA